MCVLKLDSITGTFYGKVKEIPPTDPEEVMKFGDFCYPTMKSFTAYLAPTGRDSMHCVTLISW